MHLDWTQGDLATGLARYQAGEFFKAHEFWENIWKTAPEPEKTFLQALIQIAGAHHHLQRSNIKGAILLMQGALRRLTPYPTHFASMPIASIRDQLQHRIHALQQSPADFAHAPVQIRPEP